MDSDSSEINLVIITRRDRFKIFCKLYWRTIVTLLAPIILLPIAFIKNNAAYTSFYVFLLMLIYWTADVLHPTVIAIIPIAISSIMSGIDRCFIREVYIGNDLLDCIGVMMLIIAIENSNIHRRIALKILLIVGCSHYRLSLVLFFTTMFLSMWISNILACGFMMPVVKAILVELEKMGILEVYQTIGKSRQRSNRHEENVPRPSDFTIFYFLGIAYSSSIGDMATLTGSHTNRIFKIYCETIFPVGPKLEYPHFLLLNLPGVLVMETLLYVWMNAYFLGMFRTQSSMALQIGMTDEETQYINTLLATQYQQLGKVKFHELAVATVVMLAVILQVIVSTDRIDHEGSAKFHYQIYVSSPCLFCVVLLFITPVRLDFIKFFKKDSNEPLPISHTKSCLNWAMLSREINWSVPLILVDSSSLFESLRDSEMTVELESFFLNFANWPLSAMVLAIVLCCKILTEFATSPVVVYALLPSIAKMSVICDINPHFMMTAVTLGSSLSFHLVTGSAANAMVCAYVHIPPWKMMSAGLGPSVMAVVVVWFTVAVWSTVIWTDIHLYPEWADINVFKILNKHHK